MRRELIVLAQILLWFDGLTRARKNKVISELVSGEYDFNWNAETQTGETVKIR